MTRLHIIICKLKKFINRATFIKDELDLEKIKTFALVLMIVVFAVHTTSFVMATYPEANSTIPSANTAHLEPTKESVNSVKTTVDSTTVKVNPLEVVATPVDSASSTIPWQYLSIGVGVAIFSTATFMVLVFKRRRYKFSRLRFLSLMVLASLLMMSTAQVCGEEDLTVSIWDLASTNVRRPTIIRESVDSAGNVWFGSCGWGTTDVRGRLSCLIPSTNELKIWVTPEDNANIMTVSVDNADKIWFADTNLQRIGRFEPSTNFFTIWPVSGIGCFVRHGWWPDLGALPLVSIDSYGNAYFSEYLTNKIGCIDTSTNQLTEWTIPTIDSGPCYTMVDSDDNVWFAEFSGNKIGRLNPDTSEITEWLIPTPSSLPSGLYVTEGLIYFAESLSGKIGCLNPSTNEVTQWSTRGVWRDTAPFGLSIDLNGNAWFVCYKHKSLFRLGTNNILTYWDFPVSSSALGVTVDRKLNIGDVYVAAGWRTREDIFDIIRFHSTV